MVVSGSRDNSVMCWDVRSRAQDPAQTLNDAKDSISSIKVSDHEILSSSFDCKIRRYDMRVGELLTDYLGGMIIILIDKYCFVLFLSFHTARVYSEP